VIQIIRSAGERTEAACKRLLPGAIVIRVEPFVDAVRRCFEMAIDSGEDWLLVADADVLTYPGFVDRLRNRIEDTDAFQVQGRIKDKLSGSVRDGGNRIYRVAMLKHALPMLRDAQRVETDLLLRMDAAGYRRMKVKDVCGLHDYEQWYADLYRKGAAHAAKHAMHFEWPHRWRASGDADLLAAYAGWHGQKWSSQEKEPLPATWMPF
jgi:hypothetical protein